MRTRSFIWACIIVCVAVVAVSLEAQAPSGAPPIRHVGEGYLRSRPAPGPEGAIPRLPDGKPDLSGTWLSGGVADVTREALKGGDTVEMLPAARKIFETRQAKDDPASNCLPAMVTVGTGPFPWRIVTTPTHAFFLYEMHAFFRQVFMDGRGHPAHLDPTWYGHSIGRWDGDTLVVDTIGYNDKGWLDHLGHPRTTKMHTIERYTRQDFGNLAIGVTVDDPGSYAKPFTVASKARLVPEELMEYVCEDNNRFVDHLVGPPAFR